ncbi:unnamed protein product [Aphanomyces euteiches]
MLSLFSSLTSHVECFHIARLVATDDEGETVFQPALIDDKLFDFLRAIHVFPATTKSFTQHETMNFLGQYLNENAVAGHQSGVDVMAYFGKQAAVQDQLTSAGWWPNKEIAPGLSSEAEGVYCLSFAHNGTTRVVVFAWLGDASFIAGLVRPTYVLRVLTRLASSVVFCLTDDDIAQAKTVTRELAAPLSSKKLSVSLSVHTAPVEENKIQCTINYEAGWGDQFEGGVLIAGPVVSIAVVTCTATDSTTYTTKSFESALEFAVWLDEIMDTKAVELQCGLPTAYMASAMQYRKEFPVNVMNWSSSDTMEQAASQAAERYVMDQVAELKERCEENTEVVFYQKIASADQEKAAFEALQKDLDEVRGWYARANKDPRSKIFDFRSSIDECVNAHYFRLVKQEKAKEAGAFGKFQYWFSSPDAVSFPYLAQSDLVKKAVEDAKSELSDLRQRWSQNLQHVLLHKKVLAALVVEARAALMQRALKLQKDEAIRKEFAAMIDRNNSLRSSLDKVILSSFNERTSNLSIAHLKIESTSNMLTLYECEKKLPTFQGHVTLPPTAEVIFITRGNKICIVVYRLENDEVTHVAAYKHYKTSKCLLDRVVPSAVVLCSFDPTSRVLALLHSKCLVGIYVFNKSYKSLDRIDGVNLMLLRLDPPYNHIVVFGGSTLGLTVMDHAGRIQSYFVQTKKISTLIDDASIANGDTKMISWHTGSMVVLLTPRTVRHDYYDVDVQIIDSTDNAMQPKTRLVLPKAIDWCRCSIQWTGETLVCFDPDSTRVRIWTLRLATSKAICQMEGIETEATEPSPLEIHPLRSLYHLFKTGTWSDLIAPTKLLSGPLHFQIRGEKHGQDVVKAVLSILMKDLQVENKGLISMNLEKVCTILEDEPPMWSGSTVSVSLWIFELVNLVPVQICRIRNNRLILVTNGRDEIELKAGFDVHEVARSIDFGFISALLHHWSGRVVVVSSMGKHKNDENIRYVLGNVFAAKRDDDMDGVWLAVKIVGSQLLVALDFEASCERSAQEQIFLSFLNAAISCLSIIQIDSSCGKDVDSVFTAFQRGVSLMKEDSRFFRGKLYLHATDSYSNEQEAVISTIRDKLSVILHESHAANFVSAMYGGHVDITCAAPLGHFDHVDPLDDGSELAAVHHTQPYDSGTKFHDSLAVVLSKLCLMDWTNIQGPLMIPFTRNELHDQIRMAILCGKVSHGSLDQGDLAAHVSEWITPFADSTLWKELPDDESLEFALNLDVETLRSLPDAKAIMLSFFKLYLDFIQIPRNASTEKEFDRVWNGLVLRRELLVRQWLAKLPSVGRNEIDDMDTCLLKLKQLLRRCQHSCDQSEMCPLVCSDVGRGHVHFQPCAQRASNCLATDGRKHYQQSFSTSSSLDEVLHETYWALQGWEDPVTSAAEKELFKLCSYKCHSIEHDVKAPSYCTLEAWHQPMVKSDLRAAQANWSVVEGHLLSCQHSAPRGLAHHVFVLAISGGSLGPTRLAVTNAVQAYLQEQMARKGGFECGDVVSVVISAAHGVILSEAEPIAAVVKADLSVKDFGSDLDVGLRCAIELLSRSRLHSDYSPTLVFFSDGSAGKDGVGLADHLVANYALYNLLCYVVAFSNADQESLKQLNRHLHGVYWPVVSEIDLKNAFKSISAREYARTG